MNGKLKEKHGGAYVLTDAQLEARFNAFNIRGKLALSLEDFLQAM